MVTFIGSVNRKTKRSKMTITKKTKNKLSHSINQLLTKYLNSARAIVS